MRLSCPVWRHDLQWKRAVERADAEHEAHLRLASEIGITNAVEQLVRGKRSRQAPTRVALRFIGFLLGFLAAVTIAILLGSTRSPGVFAVFAVACLASVLAPIPFRTRFQGAIETFRRELAQELSSAVPR